MHNPYGTLTLQIDQSYGLPVLESFPKPKPVSVDTGEHDPTDGERIFHHIQGNVWSLWTPKELVDNGVCMIHDMTPDFNPDAYDKDEESFTDVLETYVVKRTYVLIPKDLAVVQKTIITKAKNLRETECRMGLEFSLGDNDYVMQTGVEDRANMNGKVVKLLKLVAQGAAISELPDIVWRVSSNDVATFSGEEFLDLADAVESYIEDCFTSFHAHEASIKELEDIDKVAAYDHTKNWPTSPIK